MRPASNQSLRAISAPACYIKCYPTVARIPRAGYTMKVPLNDGTGAFQRREYGSLRLCRCGHRRDAALPDSVSRHSLDIVGNHHPYSGSSRRLPADPLNGIDNGADVVWIHSGTMTRRLDPGGGGAFRCLPVITDEIKGLSGVASADEAPGRVPALASP